MQCVDSISEKNGLTPSKRKTDKCEQYKRYGYYCIL